ncbi:MAG: substrate-binding domain-containing protein [Clostridiales bacterium]|jgi:phosphate transport system substrate-binding protein|nr:substrate-binding domain-containing protein [Clostridiales bacterium]
MKKIAKILLVVLCVCVSITALASCINKKNQEKEILVVSREAGSGTRDAFDGLIKNSSGDSLAKKADGTVQSTDIFVKSLNVQDSTSKVMTKIASSESAIGYISLGSVNDTVKAVSVNGVVPSSETVLNGSYALKRPFVIMTNNGVSLTAATEDFMKYLESTDAQNAVAANGYVRQDGSGKNAYVAPTSLSGTVVLRGSTSMEPLMDKLIADYYLKGGAAVAGITFDLDTLNSNAGIAAAKSDTVGNVIGMSSSALKAADKAVLNSFDIALDAVAVIVNPKNEVSNLTIEQIFDIYTGAIKKFSEIK